MGLRPDGIIGHSLGEVACGYADGCLSQEEAVLAAYWRAQCIKEANIPPGAMAAVGRYCPALPHPTPPMGLRVSMGGDVYAGTFDIGAGQRQGSGVTRRPPSSSLQGESDPDSLLQCALCGLPEPDGLGAQHTCPWASVEASMVFP